MKSTLFGLAAALSLAQIVVVAAAPVPGYEAQYAANFAACSLPTGTLADCEPAINAQVAALLAGGVDQVAANSSFTALRKEVFAANSANSEFQSAVDALFELLLPDSGAVTQQAPGAPGGDAPDSLDSGPSEISPT